MKKLFYILGIGLLMASCTEDFKDWADPMSNSECSDCCQWHRLHHYHHR